MTETREEQLEARAARAGLTLIPLHEGGYLVVYDPDADWEGCADLDAVEEIIEANERSVHPEHDDRAGLPPWAELPDPSDHGADTAPGNHL